MKFFNYFFIKIPVHFIILVCMLTVIPPAYAAPKPAEEEDFTFDLTEADIKGLNLNDTEAQELRQFFDALNNLSPAEKQQLKKIGTETEEKMRKKNLDPANFDDLVKFMEDQEKEAKGEKPTPVTPILEEKPKIVEKPVIVPVTSPKDTLSLLREIERKTDTVLVKTKSREVLSKKLSSLQQEMAEFRYYIKILQAPDLVLLLATKDFGKLHKTLETLHKALATNEPSIIARKRSGDVDDPYEMLGIEYNATPEQIANAYKHLQEVQSPEAVEKSLKSSTLPEKDRKKRLKESRLTWSFIQGAYETLIDPKERAIVRKELKNKIDEEARYERTSIAAFDKLFNAFTTAFFPQGLLSDIRSLLEKHKPQELELAKKALETEKKVAERAKQAVRIETTPTRAAVSEQPYEAFYQKMAQESYMRPQYPAPMAAPAAPTPISEKKEESKKPAADGKKKPDGKGKPAGKGKGKEGDKKGGSKPITKKDIPKLSAIDAVVKILKAAKDSIEYPAEKKRGAKKDDKPVMVPVKYDVIAHNLAADLKKPVTREVGKTTSIAALQTEAFFKQNHFDELASALKRIAPGYEKGQAKALSQPICDEWEEKVWNQYGAMIQKWTAAFYRPFSSEGGGINKDKAELYKLANNPEPDYFSKDKDAKKPDQAAAKTQAKGKKPVKDETEKAALAEEDGEQEKVPAVDLSKIRNTIKAIDVYFQNISQGCKLRTPPAVPIKKTAPPKSKDKSDEDEDKEDEDHDKDKDDKDNDDE